MNSFWWLELELSTQSFFSVLFQKHKGWTFSSKISFLQSFRQKLFIWGNLKNCKDILSVVVTKKDIYFTAKPRCASFRFRKLRLSCITLARDNCFFLFCFFFGIFCITLSSLWTPGFVKGSFEVRSVSPSVCDTFFLGTSQRTFWFFVWR